MEHDNQTLGDVFIAWTGMTETLITSVIIFLGLLGLVLSLISFVNLYGSIKESDQGMMQGEQSPAWHMLGIIVAGLVSVSGLIWGMSSLIFSSAGG